MLEEIVKDELESENNDGKNETKFQNLFNSDNEKRRLINFCNEKK